MIMKRTFLSTITAEAHCDVPCGIYDPTPAKIAAKTVARMVQQINELALPLASDKKALDAYQNAISRRVATKEESAEICKNELEILWADFFKEEHLKVVPELHTMFWKAVKLCSYNKHEVDAEHADELLAAVDAVAEAFYRVKNVPERYKAYQEITDNLY